jgi:hypothetical protein
MVAVAKCAVSGVAGREPVEVGVPLTEPPPQLPASRATTDRARIGNLIFIVAHIIGLSAYRGSSRSRPSLLCSTISLDQSSG